MLCTDRIELAITNCTIKILSLLSPNSTLNSISLPLPQVHNWIAAALRIVCLLSMIEQEKISLSHMIKFYMKNSELDWIEGQETVVTYLHEKGNRPENIDRWLTASSQCWSASLSALLSLDKPFPTCTHQGHIWEREREDIQQSLRHLLETNHKQHSKGFLPQERGKNTLIQDHTISFSILLK